MVTTDSVGTGTFHSCRIYELRSRKGLLFFPYSPALTVHSGVDLVLSQALLPVSAVWI